MTQPPPGLTRHRFRHHPLSLATTHGITCCFLFHRVLRCFTSPGSLHTPYFIQMRVTGHHASRVPPFGHPRINARLTAPRGLSRPPTSFIGSWYQGIHRAPLLTYHTPRPHGPRGNPGLRPGGQHRTSRHYNRNQTITDL